MKKTSIKKLQFKSETVRHVGKMQLGKVGGAGTRDSITCSATEEPSYTCPPTPRCTILCNGITNLCLPD